MIEVRVQLRSAISRLRDTELARFVIVNDGTGDGDTGNYRVESYRGRSAVQLDRRVKSRAGRVESHPRQTEHVLNLVAKALNAMGYGQPPSRAARRGIAGPPIAQPLE